MYAGELVETGAAAVLFAFVFLAGGRLHPLRWLVRDRRTIVSFGEGDDGELFAVDHAGTILRVEAGEADR